MSPECECAVLAQNTRWIIGISQNAAKNELLIPEKRAELKVLPVLAFTNKHSTINTSLLSLQKTYSVSKSVI